MLIHCTPPAGEEAAPDIAVNPADPACKQDLHRTLTDLAVRWLKRANSAGGHGCQIAMSECWARQDGEKPDAIGWRTSGFQDGTVLVEVKVSRADFLADARKPHRCNPATGVGRWRYYLCPQGMLQPEEMPPGWGLLWVTPRNGVRAMTGAAAALTHHSKDAYHQHAKFEAALDAFAHDRDVEHEMAMLARLVQRFPDIESHNNRLRELRNFNAALIKKLEQARRDIQRLQMERCSWAETPSPIDPPSIPDGAVHNRQVGISPNDADRAIHQDRGNPA